MNGSSGNHSLSLGIALVGIALPTLLAAADIDRPGLGSKNEPGPAAFPIALGALLLAGGLHELIGWWRQRSTRSTPAGPVTACIPDESPPTDHGKRTLILFIVALFLYLPALRWLGFFISTGLLAIPLAWRLGSRLWVAAVASASLLLAVKLLFDVVFKVSLPGGPFGF